MWANRLRNIVRKWVLKAVFKLNDSYAEVGEVQDFIFQERASMSEGDAAKMTVSLKVDQKTKMGIVTDVKNALRKSYALKINYSATKRGEK